MKKDRLHKLETSSQKVISEYFTKYLKEVEIDFWLINITKVEITNDLSYLDIYVSSFKNSELLCKTLANYAQDIVKAINKKIIFRKIPKIRFRYDKSWKIWQDVIKTINSL